MLILSRVLTKEKTKKKLREPLIIIKKPYQSYIRGSKGFKSFFNHIKTYYRGLKKVTYREVRRNDIRIIGHKSTALAAQSFMISMAALGYDTCPMEGFDSVRLKSLLKLPRNAEISMVIGCGVREEDGLYGERFRLPLKEVYFSK